MAEGVGPVDEGMDESRSGLEISLAGPADRDAIISILEEASEWLLSRGIRQWLPGSFPPELIEGRIARGELYLGRVDGEPAGTFTLLWSDPEIWGERPPDAGYVHSLAVSRAHAGCGLGQKLLRHAEKIVGGRGRRYLRLDCWNGSEKLREYYTGARFRHVGDRSFEGDPGWAASLFEKRVGRLEES